MLADLLPGISHNLPMSDEPLKLQEKLAAEYHARWETVETFNAQELAAMTEEQAEGVIRPLRLFAPAPPNPLNGMGLVEQPAISQRAGAKDHCQTHSSRI